MEQSPLREDNNPSRSQEIFRLSWKPKVYYHVHKSMWP